MNVRMIHPGFGFLVAMFCIPAAPAQDPQDSQVDPPSRVARIALAQGNVSLEPAHVDTFSQAELNYPLTAGDRVYADVQSLAELQTSGLAIRMGNGADVTLSSLTDQVAQFGLAQGSIRVSTRELPVFSDGSASVVEIDTPNGSILVQAVGDIRIDSYPQDDTTVVTVTTGQVEVTGPNLDVTVGPNQSLRLAGSNPVTTQWLRLLPPDNLDRFDQDRESLYQGAVAAEGQYVSQDMIGASDLNQYGDWSPSPDYGEVWYPRGVAVDWTPYHYGHWAWVAPWGWTWVEAEPWGFAPFHYGRWAVFNGRWGWIPGPPPSVWGRPVRPVYSPALVAFVGGPGFSLSIGFGGASGAGVTAWFPLGPREPYVPWYHTSPAYVNRVNVTNIYNRNAAEVRNTYVNRTTNVYVTNTTNVTYVNRTVATTAVTQRDFAAGHPVASGQPVRLDANARQQLNQAPVLPHPLVTPSATIAAPSAPARALPPSQSRPVLETRAQFKPPTQPAGTPQPVRLASPTAPVSANPNRPPTSLSPAPVQTQSFPQQRDHQPMATQPAQPTAPAQSFPPRQPAAPQPAAQPTPQPARPVVAAPAAPRPPDQPRTLINRTEPQAPAPPFAQQQREIERNDPGRPLAPQQLDNMRSGRPAGPPPPEPAHPAPPPAKPAQKNPEKPKQ
jgi:hypothetical protein